MSLPDDAQLGDMSLFELFRSELETHTGSLTDGLLKLERDSNNVSLIEPLMRAAHSIKGAARIVNINPIVQLAHGMEECFVAVQNNKIKFSHEQIDALLTQVDILCDVSKLPEAGLQTWLIEKVSVIAQAIAAATSIVNGTFVSAKTSGLIDIGLTPVENPAGITLPPDAQIERKRQTLHVSAENFDHLLALASEARVAANSLHPQMQALLRFKQKQNETIGLFKDLEQLLVSADSKLSATLKQRASEIRHKLNPLQLVLQERLDDLDVFERRLLRVSNAMFDEVLAVRMRPFSEGVGAFPRMVRDLAQNLGKQARLEIKGGEALVDRDILAKMEAPLNHLLRNALDHGLEMPEQRLAANKPAEGCIRIDARHIAGMMCISIEDDGRGVDLETIRTKVIQKKMVTPEMARQLSDSELLEFLFLPAFSLKQTVSELSGRGVGLDVVLDTVRELYGTVKLESMPGLGFRTHIILPLTRSIVRAVVVEIAGEAYACPITKIEQLLRVPTSAIHLLENKQFISLNGEHIGLISASQLLELNDRQRAISDISIILIGTGQHRYGLVVDAILGEHNLAVQSLEATFGKLRNIHAASLLDDGTPVLILDVEDILRSVDILLSEGRLNSISTGAGTSQQSAKRILVVDDSLTVREMERKLLTASGFDVTVAVDGIDGWNAVRSGEFDLVITDIDMPRMDGIELVSLIKKDVRLHALPIMIVSYKDRPEDRSRGLSAGADFYLTKGSFHDESLMEAVFDLIGAAREK